MSENSELRDRGAVCILSDSRGAREGAVGKRKESERRMGGGGWSRWAGREEASVTDSKRGKEQRATRSLAGAADWVFKCVIVSAS